ncbi:MAG: hypothetical protein EHM71_16040 [Zetaproteobacteria bacterium]|nr:MAG: hypothetical protein EHM71_16040 [Zetaproteobacteria bacterium]
MPIGRTAIRRHGWTARAVFLGALLLPAGCATTEKPLGPPTLVPAPQQHVTTNQVVGDAIVASLGGVSVTVRWMDSAAVGEFYSARPGLVSPWPQEVWTEAPPTLFLVRVRNQTHEESQFDPGMARLVTQDGDRDLPVPYEEMYMRLSDTENSGLRLQSLQATLLSRFLVIRPGGFREGLLLFPTVKPEAKYLVLDLGSFFVGGRPTPGHFAFQVLRKR